MNKPPLIVGISLMLFAALVMGLKVFALDMPLLPSDPGGLWHVELSATVRGNGEKGSVRVALPSSDRVQVIYDEHSAGDRLEFSIRRREDVRTGVFQGVLDGTHRLVYGFRVKLSDHDGTTSERAPTDDERRTYVAPSAAFPVETEEVKDVLQQLALPPVEEIGARARALHAFVVHEVTAVDGEQGDALITLSQREGTPAGKAHLLVTLLRAATIPSRIVTGLTLIEGSSPLTVVFVEAFVDGAWISLSPIGAFFGARPGNIVVVRRGEGPLVETASVVAIDHRFRAARERLNAAEVAAMMVPSSTIMSTLSLYRLPLHAQTSIKLLLLFPFGALVLAIFRNLIGVPTFGTFMPLLLAFALRGSGFFRGLVLIALVMAIAIGSRVFLERLRLLIVPRLSVLLSVLVLLVTGMAITGATFGVRDFFQGLLFPIVILTMLVERASVTLVEEGTREALRVSAYSVLVAAFIFPVLTSETLSVVVFGFPELVVGVTGVLIILGGYTGYRAMELLRFKSLALPPKAAS